MPLSNEDQRCGLTDQQVEQITKVIAAGFRASIEAQHESTQQLLSAIADLAREYRRRMGSRANAA